MGVMRATVGCGAIRRRRGRQPGPASVPEAAVGQVEQPSGLPCLAANAVGDAGAEQLLPRRFLPATSAPGASGSGSGRKRATSRRSRSTITNMSSEVSTRQAPASTSRRGRTLPATRLITALPPRRSLVSTAADTLREPTASGSQRLIAGIKPHAELPGASAVSAGFHRQGAAEGPARDLFGRCWPALTPVPTCVVDPAR